MAKENAITESVAQSEEFRSISEKPSWWCTQLGTEGWASLPTLFIGPVENYWNPTGHAHALSPCVASNRIIASAPMVLDNEIWFIFFHCILSRSLRAYIRSISLSALLPFLFVHQRFEKILVDDWIIFDSENFKLCAAHFSFSWRAIEFIGEFLLSGISHCSEFLINRVTN